jgi:exodeoxyribonuclease VII large subunit
VTGRLPFDPDKMKRKRDGTTRAARGSVSSTESDKPISVSQLAARIETAVKQTFPTTIRVLAEVSAVTHRTHYYFTLKDEHASVSAVLFASSAKRSKTLPTHGDQVIAKGRLDYYAPSGRLSLIVDSLEPVGAGALERKLRELVDELKAKGWLDDAIKKPLPVFPRRIAVITSETSAALQDVLDTARKRCPAVDIAILDVRVQGDRATTEIASAIRYVSTNHDWLGIDAIILTRGGGSLEDLWSFNERAVAKAIHDCAVPVVAAIGHETDTTVAELVADLRCATPTQAAMRLVPDRAALLEQLDALTRRLTRETRASITTRADHLTRLATRGPLADPARLVDPARAKLTPLARHLRAAIESTRATARRDLDRLALRLARHQPAAVHARRDQQLSDLTARLRASVTSRIARRNDNLLALARELDAISPLRVLDRGYSVTTTESGALVRSASALKPGDPLNTRLPDGVVHSTVAGANTPLTPTTKPKPRRRLQSPDQMDLF